MLRDNFCEAYANLAAARVGYVEEITSIFGGKKKFVGKLKEIFLFRTASRTTLGLTQSPIQWVPWVLSLGVKRPRREADHSPPSSAEVKE
jgi:hypothetical protein